jgi:uncharacterized sporulation protein YeaH/YhbH (DUF444 family)
MATIVDRRFVKDITVPINRQRFLKRYKDAIRSQVHDYVKDTKIKDIKNKFNKIKIKKNDLLEPSFSFDPKQGTHQHISTGNKQFQKHDKLKKAQGASGQGNGKGQGGKSDDPNYDDLTFTLTKDEFFDLFFDDLGLPNFIKQAFRKEYRLKFKRAGYTKVGSYAKLNLKKTFEHALMRKIAAKNSQKSVPFLDDIDLRYNLFIKQPIYVGKAVMFCVMDISGSMTSQHRFLAKNFYLLLYLFLEKVYNDVTIHFIVYHQVAYEVDEEKFFKVGENGGTEASCALLRVEEIIKEKYADGNTNLYLAHTSDGDNWDTDNEAFATVFTRIAHHFQYIIYIDLMVSRLNRTNLGRLYAKLAKKLHLDYVKLKTILKKRDIYPALRDLFKKQEY